MLLEKVKEAHELLSSVYNLPDVKDVHPVVRIKREQRAKNYLTIVETAMVTLSQNPDDKLRVSPLQAGRRKQMALADENLNSPLRGKLAIWKPTDEQCVIVGIYTAKEIEGEYFNIITFSDKCEFVRRSELTIKREGNKDRDALMVIIEMLDVDERLKNHMRDAVNHAHGTKKGLTKD
jgi:hypothetical protein